MAMEHWCANKITTLLLVEIKQDKAVTLLHCMVKACGP